MSCHSMSCLGLPKRLVNEMHFTEFVICFVLSTGRPPAPKMQFSIKVNFDLL